ncbi:hypothetical protein ACL02T_17235 [Pseudonocardia sp. RS010]|uniref:hypothetical protein n=1 Tax=Pseudonocardia sp. RS010 TaxID=3385979 RepID=UPI0039A26643
MRRTAVALGVVALVAAGGVAAATGASAAPTSDPAVAHGYYLAQNGTAPDGTWSPQSDALVDPEVGHCYDLTSLATGPGTAWTESVNRTDKVALLSTRTCTQQEEAATENATGETAAAARRAARWTSPDSVSPGSGEYTFRSVSFATVP